MHARNYKHEISIISIVEGWEREIMILKLSFFEDHKPYGKKGNSIEFILDDAVN